MDRNLNATDNAIDLGGDTKLTICEPEVRPLFTILAGTIVPAKGYYVWETNSYFNNSGDEAYLIAPDGAVVDSFNHSSKKYDASWYRYPDGGTWAAQMDTTPTKGASNQKEGQ